LQISAATTERLLAIMTTRTTVLGRSEEQQRATAFCLVSAAVQFLALSLVWKIVSGSARELAAAWLVGASAASLTGFFLLARFRYQRVMPPGLLAKLQAYQLIVAVAAGYAMAPEVRAVLLCSPAMAILFSSFALSRGETARLAAVGAAMLGTTMLVLSISQPEVFVPTQEGFHFGITVVMLGAAVFLAGEFRGLVLQSRAQKAEMMRALARISLLGGPGPDADQATGVGGGASAPARGPLVVTRPMDGLEGGHMVDLSGTKVLVVEDDDLQRDAMIALLEDLGASGPLFAHDGHSALTRLAAPDHGVQVIVTDLNMPGMDGIEFIRQLGESRAPVSVVLVSAVNSSVLKGVEKVAQAYGIALLGVLQKPVLREQLARVLSRLNASRPVAPRTGAVFEQCTAGELKQALSNGEFEPFFQAKVNLQTGTIEGYEALSRWRRPGLGIVPPAAFIGVMEASGLIDELTDVILDKSVAACAQWRKLGFDYGVSINVSVLTLSQPDCAQRVLRIVKEHGVDPGCVTIEMTESSADATELKTVLGNLSRLRIHGFGLSIDDYGTGYSSMDRLARIAFTELKIDQSFVAEASTNPSAMAIIRSSVGMANVLQLVSVAEGVETKEHWELVRGIGCELAQGYYISPPVEARAVPRMALEWLKRVQAGEIRTTMDISPGR
jgi:EAL domain-containing protein (putative c-di-GMP-specific phosphodiesterase class I)/CheY-like chemotaxis protein